VSFFGFFHQCHFELCNEYLLTIKKKRTNKEIKAKQSKTKNILILLVPCKELYYFSSDNKTKKVKHDRNKTK